MWTGGFIFNSPRFAGLPLRESSIGSIYLSQFPSSGGVVRGARNSLSTDTKCDVSTWRLYDAELARLATQRAALLLRIIMVDTKPLEDVILSNLKAGATPALQ